ncbi:xanthine dehydrogenase small subunit [Kushneria marisflavi]|uniref:Xanthine dehydrogenase small subunit n=1 Tax=Kushneria marisflavi TaxID=157779 RepID=A0A240UM47_9GAMM|nr:xanthine dehydrogenase small subunit [Kushneria marisflavi]ART62577.1 xanthine dehydrogenase small subunit [Kushneria marisflavi]RKD84046.1 xanthine dehydrogenase small subunit [Kushneria marisflavi]
MLTLTLNGQRHCLNDLPAATTALSLLRGHLGACGTKEGCASGDCGACTIAVGTRNDRGELHYHSANACILPAHQLHGCHLLTVEGLARREALHPVQQALVEHHGSQCGFCTPGIVMSLFCLDDERRRQGVNGPPDDDTIDAVLGGNLCRCTGYRAIREAARAMHTLPRPAMDDPGELSPVSGAPASGFYRPESRSALVEILTQHPRARLIAGGTDLMLEHTLALKPLPELIDLSGVAELGHIDEQNEGWWIGAGVTYHQLAPLLADHYPAFHALLERLGSQQIRHCATLAGNLANASPIGDTPPILMALGARLRLNSTRGMRELPIDEFFTGYRCTALTKGEYLDAVYLPRLRDGEQLLAWKVSKRRDDDISAVMLALRAVTDQNGRLNDVRIACGGMAATSQRARHVEAALEGRVFDGDVLADACKAIAEDFSPIDDVRASREYRLAAIAGLLARARLRLTSRHNAIPMTLEEI